MTRCTRPCILNISLFRMSTKGTPTHAYEELKEELAKLDEELVSMDQKITSVVADRIDELAAASAYLKKRSASFDIRKYAALTKEKDNVFYILCGWMPEDQADAFQKEIEDDEQTFVVVEDDHDNIFSTPPTKLHNLKIFRPFEMYVKMYGLPAYNEMDPTMFVAITYAFIFGAMFGDVGQGLVLLLGGFFLYKKKGMDLAAIIGSAGILSPLRFNVRQFLRFRGCASGPLAEAQGSYDDASGGWPDEHRIRG